jgi:hypothetical protein
MKLIDFINGAAIQALLVTPAAYLVSPYFFTSPLGVFDVSLTFFIILLGYLTSASLFRLLPKSVSPNLIVMLAIGGLIAMIFGGVFVLSQIFFGIYSEVPIPTGVGFIIAMASIASILTWVMRHVT